MYMTGHPEGKPVRAGGSVVDVLAGTHAGMRSSRRCAHATAGGTGQMVDIALFDVAMSTIGFHPAGTLADRPGSAAHR